MVTERAERSKQTERAGDGADVICGAPTAYLAFWRLRGPGLSPWGSSPAGFWVLVG